MGCCVRQFEQLIHGFKATTGVEPMTSAKVGTLLDQLSYLRP